MSSTKHNFSNIQKIVNTILVIVSVSAMFTMCSLLYVREIGPDCSGADDTNKFDDVSRGISLCEAYAVYDYKYPKYKGWPYKYLATPPERRLDEPELDKSRQNYYQHNQRATILANFVVYLAATSFTYMLFKAYRAHTRH